MNPGLDHLVYAVPDLEAGAHAMGARLGIEPVWGGSHPDWGTANALVDLGDERYLEIIGPDPDRRHSPVDRPFGIDALAEPRLTTWALRVADFDACVARARAAGYDPGAIRDMERRRADGTVLRWRLTSPGPSPHFGGLVPFLIDWGESDHPTATLESGCQLEELAIAHPQPDRLRPIFEAFGVANGIQNLAIRHGPTPSLHATIGAPGGAVDL